MAVLVCRGRLAALKEIIVVCSGLETVYFLFWNCIDGDL